MNSLRFLVLFLLSQQVFGQKFEPYFKELSEQLHLSPPKLPRNSYQVRLWVDTSLPIGEAKELYLITQKRKRLFLKKYTIVLKKGEYQRHTVNFKKRKKNTTFFSELIANAVLTSRDQSIITDSLYNMYRSFKQTPRVEMSEGGVSVITQKPPAVVRVIGGTTYYFEVVGKGFFKKYSFHSPKSYARTYPSVKELVQNVDLVRRIYIAFSENTKDISYVSSPSNRHFTRF